MDGRLRTRGKLAFGSGAMGVEKAEGEPNCTWDPLNNYQLHKKVEKSEVNVQLVKSSLQRSSWSVSSPTGCLVAEV